MWRTIARHAGVGLISIASTATSFAQTTIRVGGEFQVNVKTISNQSELDLDVDDDGDFVVTWQSAIQDGGFGGVFARRFSSAGAGVGGEFQVNTYTIDIQHNPAVAMDHGGSFVVVWVSSVQDQDQGGIFAQRWSANGSQLGVEFQVNTHTQSNQRYPSLAIAPDGGFVIVWESFQQDGPTLGVFGRRFASGGGALASEFQINTYTPTSQGLPDVAIDGDGDFVVAWTSYAQDASGYGIFAQRFDSSGLRLGGELQVNVNEQGHQLSPAVGIDDDGDFVIAYDSIDFDPPGIFIRRFDSAGTPLGGELQVNVVTYLDQTDPEIAMEGGGAFVVTWGSEQDYGGFGIFARRFDAVGTPLAVEFQVNTYSTAAQDHPAIGMDNDGDFVIAWESNGQDGDGEGSFAQRFATLAVLDIDGDGKTAALTDGLLVLRSLFGFTGTTLVTGAVDNACTRCLAPAIEAYIDTADSAFAQPATRAGTELQVNTYTTNFQAEPAIDAETNGDFVVVWQSSLQDGNGGSIFGRRFTSAGSGLGAELQINSYTSGLQDEPAVAMDTSGGFVVAWSSAGQDGDSSGIFARRFSSTGSALASEFQANTYTPFVQRSPAVAMSPGGAFVVSWSSQAQDGDNYGVFARRFDASGTPQATEFQINSYTTTSQGQLAVAMDDTGRFVVTWSSAHDGGGYGVFARRYNSNAVPQAFDFQVNVYTVGHQAFPDVSLAADGGFVIAYEGFQDGYSPGIFARRFGSTGVAQAVEFQVNLVTFGYQTRPEIAVGSAGDFVVTWQSQYAGSYEKIFARRFDSAGDPRSGQFQVNAYTSSGQRYPGVAIDGDGDFAIAWEGDLVDGSNTGVLAQRFVTLSVFDIDGDGETDALTDGLLVLRYLFGFTGSTLVSGAVDVVACTRCTAPTIEGYLQTLI